MHIFFATLLLFDSLWPFRTLKELFWTCNSVLYGTQCSRGTEKDKAFGCCKDKIKAQCVSLGQNPPQYRMTCTDHCFPRYIVQIKLEKTSISRTEDKHLTSLLCCTELRPDVRFLQAAINVHATCVRVKLGEYIHFSGLCGIKADKHCVVHQLTQMSIRSLEVKMSARNHS